MSEPLEGDSKTSVEPAGRPSWNKRALVWITRLWEDKRRRRFTMWLTGLLILGIVWCYSNHHHWPDLFRAWLNAGLQAIADPSHLADVLLGIGTAVVLALWWLPKWQAAGSQGIGAENRFDRENEARKTLAQIVAGVFVLVGLYSSVKTFDLQRKSADLQRQSADFQREGQITDRFTKAVDQLGALAPGGGVDAEGRPKPNLVVRIGGIYALERIAHDSPKDHWTIMEVLTAYVRENSPRRDRAVLMQGKQSSAELGKADIVQKSRLATVAPDIQSILTVIGRRDISRDPEGRQIDLHGANLSGANLTRAHLEGAFLDEVDLDDAQLSEANLERLSLRHAHLERTNLVRANLVRANLFDAHLDGAHLGEADFSRANLNRAHLNGASLIGANFSHASLNLAELIQADLKEAKLNGADLVGAELNAAECSGADLSGVHLDHAHLGRTILNRANLSGASLVGADLAGASLYFGDFSRAQLDGANLADADLRGADLATVNGLLLSQLARTLGDTETKLPFNITPPTYWNNLSVPKHRLLGN